MKVLELKNLSPYQIAFDLGDKRLVMVEIIPTLIEGLKDTFQLQGKAWQINKDGSRFLDEEGGVIMTPVKTRTVTIEPGSSGLHDQMADAAATLVEQFKLHSQLREAYLRKAALLPKDTDQGKF